MAGSEQKRTPQGFIQDSTWPIIGILLMLYTRFKTILSLLYRLIAQNKGQVDEQSHPKDGLLLPLLPFLRIVHLCDHGELA